MSNIRVHREGEDRHGRGRRGHPAKAAGGPSPIRRAFRRFPPLGALGLITGCAALSATLGCSEASQGQCTSKEVAEIFDEYGCTSCHNSTPAVSGGGLDLASEDLESRLVAQPSSNPSCSAHTLVDLGKPEASVLLRVMNPSGYAEHMSPTCNPPAMPLGGGPRVSSEDVACVEAWIRGLASGSDEAGPAPFDPAPLESVVAKSKYLLHGGAVTDAELAAARMDDGSLDRDALRALIDGWTRAEDGTITPEFETKMRMFLELSLQQTPIPANHPLQYSQQLNWGRGAKQNDQLDTKTLAATIPSVFMDTALGIVSERRDFREVVTTRRWRVTTAILTALAYADVDVPRTLNGRPVTEFTFGEFVHLQPSDYSDWRYVNFAQATAEQPAQLSYENTEAFAAAVRGVADGETVRMWAPRVGFYSTLVFFDQWQTNPDNQHRVTISQALIGSLDAIFETGDTTVPASLEGLDAEHAVEGTSCYECHTLLDPAREVFANYYEYSNQGVGLRAKETSTFAFHGHVVPEINSMDDFAGAIVTHPRFASAWTQKLCMWANSQRCDEGSPEFRRVAETFERGYDQMSPDDDFVFDILIRELFSSTLITASSSEVAHERVEFMVSPTRFGHFCHAMNTRLRAASSLRCESEGQEPTACNAPQEDCFGRWRTAQALGEDSYGRGVADFSTPAVQDPVYSLAVREACRDNVQQVTNSGSTFPRGQDPRLNITSIVSNFMGLPPSHPRHGEAVDGLLRTFQLLTAEGTCPEGQTFIEANESVGVDGEFVCGAGLGRGDALTSVFVIACTSPDFMGIGY